MVGKTMPPPAAQRRHRRERPTLTLFFICLAALLVHRPTLASDPKECWPNKIAEASLVGGPERPPHPLSVEIGKEIYALLARIAKKQNKMSELETPTPSAAVICLDWSKVEQTPLGLSPPFEHWFTAWGFSDLDTTRKEALSDCEVWRKQKPSKCSCLVLAENGAVVLATVPDDILRSYRDRPGSPFFFGWDRFQEAKERLVVLDVEDATLPSPRIVPTDGVPVQKPIPVMYPYTHVDYRAKCWGLYTYLLVDAGRPDGGQLQRLADLAKRGFYNCSSVPIDSPPTDSISPDDRVETHCKLLKAVPIGGELEHTITFPPQITEGMENAGIIPSFHTAWVELTVRLAKDNVPIEVLTGARPVALASDDRILLGVDVEWPTPEWACGVGADLPKREVLHVSKCQGQDCVAKAMRTMAESILHGMELPPIAGTRFPNDGHPEEYQLRREVEPSLVLGSSFYEKSRYLVKIWSGDSQQVLLDVITNHRGTSGGHHLYVNVTQYLTVAANRLSERYSEATDSDVSKYEKALVKAVDASVASACTTLGGTVASGVCVMNTGGTK